MIDSARDRINRAALIRCLHGADQRSAGHTGFDNEQTRRQTADDAIAHWEGLPIGRGCHRKLRDTAPEPEIFSASSRFSGG